MAVLVTCGVAQRWQGMVPLSARLEAKLSQAETQTQVKDPAWLQEQLSKAQEQVNVACLEAAKLQAEMSCMVQRSDLEDATMQMKTLEEARRSESQQHHAVVSGLQERMAVLEHEKCESLAAMQVCGESAMCFITEHCFLAVTVWFLQKTKQKLLIAHDEIEQQAVTIQACPIPCNRLIFPGVRE